MKQRSSERTLCHMEHATTWSTHSSSGRISRRRDDSPVEVLVEGLQERSRLKMMEELRRFSTVDNNEAVKIGDLDQQDFGIDTGGGAPIHF